MTCSSCGFDNPDGLRFCGGCGERLAARCPSCGAEVPPEFSFCGACGAQLDPEKAPAPAAGGAAGTTGAEAADAEPAAPSAAPAPASRPAPAPSTTGAAAPAPAPTPATGEYKRLTILTSGLCDAEAIASRMSGEALHSLLSRFFEIGRQEVERYGGSVSRYLNHGFMALFGAEVTFEDHAERGVLAALRIRQRLRRESVDGEPFPAVGTGLDTGASVVGDGGMVVGDVTGVAQGLQERASANQILLSENTIRETETAMTLEPVDDPDGTGVAARALRGLADPAVTMPRFDSESETPFVGRERELDAIRELYAQAVAGRGQVVGLTGEAGSGKSRFLFEVSKQLDTPPPLVMLGHCLSYGTGIPYSPILGMIRRAGGIPEGASAEELTANLRRGLLRFNSDVERDLPFLLRLFDVRPGTEMLDDLEPSTVQARTFSAVRNLILNASRLAPILVAIEDLHWIDETSDEFLTTLVDSMAGARVFLVLTYRPGYRPAWVNRSYATQMTVGRLSSAQVNRIAAALLERSGVPEQIDDSILAKAEGNPLFIEEMVRSWVEAQGRFDQVPETVQVLLSARIDRLPEAHRRLIRVAAVIGRDFRLRVLEGLLTGSDRPMSELLGDLVHWEFVVEKPAAEPTYRFKHALTQEVAYNSLLKAHRRDLHKRVAQVLEELYAGRLEEAYDQLVYHYPRAGDAEKTVHYLRLFAQRAARAYAHAEAAKALVLALEQASELPPDEMHRESLELLLSLVSSLLPLARLQDTLDYLRRYRDELEEVRDAGLSGRYHFWLAHTYSYLGRHKEADEVARRAVEEAQEEGDDATEGKAYYVLGRNAFWTGRFHQGLEDSLRAIVLLERSGVPWWQGQAYWVAGFHHFVVGDFGKALDALERARGISEVLEDPRLDTSWSAGYFHAALGEYETGIDRCQTGLEESRDPLNTAAALGFLGFAQLERGNFGEAVSALDDSVARMEEAGMQQLHAWFTVYLAEAVLGTGEMKRAQELARRGLERSEEASFPLARALGLRTLGKVEERSGDLDAARRQLDLALAAFEDLGVPLEAARTGFELGRVAAAAGDREAARERLREATAAFRDLGVDHWRERCETALQELESGNT